ncbi:hypothetical protein [Pseudactinotalea terrae]|uniref:hypothetical protein n=1 Tax=Pseudactinotalea terrae TaxID=1743262 RepID=UPI0013907DB9|nr:hypothetical protein [Pseudactinotalea terrae]
MIIAAEVDDDALSNACGHFAEPQFSVTIVAPKAWRARGLSPVPTTIVLSGVGRDHLSDQRPHALASESWKLWLRFRDDPAAKGAVEQADVIIALDETAIYTGWRLAKRLPTCIVSTSAATARGEFDAHAGAA